MPPETIGPYRVIASLGQGAFGAVYEAEHAETKRRTALKMLHASKALQPEVQNRFVREIALLQRLDDDHIVRHYDCGLYDGNIYCAMELVDSGSLDDVLQARGRIPWREAAEVALQTSRALAHAHDKGCVHRDLKPANLYLSADGQVKIGDFGLARDLEGSRLTTAGETVGTWRYMAPEQITGAEQIDGRLDIYALGCILFRMVAGQVPFDGANFAAIFDQHLESPPPRLDAIAPGAPRSLADLVEWMLQKSPEERPPSASVVAEKLAAILDESADEPLEAEIPAENAPSHAPAETANLTERLRAAPEPTRSEPNWRALGVAALV
ncbi:MAG: serine/threonine-protein kinase, partial [Planctomycetota bacterium]